MPEPAKVPTLEEKAPSIQKRPRPVEGTQLLHIFVLMCVFVLGYKYKRIVYKHFLSACTRRKSDA